MTKDSDPGCDSRRIRLVCLSLLASLAIACGRSKDPKPANGSMAAPATVVDDAVTDSSSAATGGKSPFCPRTGLWAACSVERRLEQAGFVVRKAATPPRRPGFSVAPIAYTLGRAKLEVFVYPDAKSLQQDWSQLDTLTGSPRGKTPLWELPPSVVRSVNLAAVYLTDSPVQAERLSLALTAGAPQPRSGAPATSQVLPTIEVRPRK
jgi:hypothetical protein